MPAKKRKAAVDTKSSDTAAAAAAGTASQSSTAASSAVSSAKDVKSNGAAAATGGWKTIPATVVSVNTINPIRAIVDKIVVPPQPADKPLIPLSIGDPTCFGNLPVHRMVEDALVNAIRSGQHNGYGPAHGLPAARKALAARFSPSNFTYSADDVFIANGCSGVLTIAISSLADAGHNILIPRPSFPLYMTVCSHYGIEAREYELLPSKGWEIDLADLESKIDSKTKAILLNNPSNPTGSNYSKAHLIALLQVAQRHHLPVIADEIYADIVFAGEKFHALASLTSAELDVPIMTCGGFAKQYLAPGWRMGWCFIHDFHHHYPKPATTTAAAATAATAATATAVVPSGYRAPVLTAVREGANRLCQLLLGATTILQAALPEIFTQLATTDYYSTLNATLQAQALYFVDGLKGCVGLTPVTPQGAMYVMVKVEPSAFTDIENDKDFAQKLLNEEFVYVLPGACFHAPNFFRVVFVAPKPKLQVACDRIKAFCLRHAKAAAK